MHELITTRNNAMIDPVMEIWGWEVAVYLFLGGLVAGMMIISGYFIAQGRHGQHDCSCSIIPPLGIVLLSLGMLALFLDLEHKLYVWRMYATFKPASPMSWGSWILLIVYPILLVSMLVRPLPWLAARVKFTARWSEMLHRSPWLIRAIGTAGIVLGILLGIYTGILLGAFGARPLWNSPVLGLLFLVSGLSTAAALVHMIARNPEERRLLARADNGFLTAELVILALFLIGLVTSTRVHIEAADLLLTGSYAPAFWVFVVGMGILLPLFIQSLAVRQKIRHTAVAPLLVIVGGLLLRFVIVFAGQASHWTRTAGLH
jgi:formate-dependent nitrite reductase membrane component NrfD